MSQNSDLQFTIGFDGIDDAKRVAKELENAEKAGDKFAKQFKNISRANRIDEIVASSVDLAKATGKAEVGAKALADELRDVGASSKEIDKAIQRFDIYTKSALRAAEATRQVPASQQSFDATSERFGIAGDAESAFRTGTGALGALGGDIGGQIEQALNSISEGFAVLEAAPKFAESLRGVGELLSQTGALGTAALGAAAAFAAFQLAMIAVNEQNKALRQSFESQVEAQRSLNSEIAGGLTSDEARQRIAELNREIEAQAPLLDDLNVAYQQMEQGVGIAGAAVKTFSDDEEALFQQLEAQRGTVKDLEAERNALNQALESGRLAAADMQAAEAALAEERTQAALAAGQEAASLEQARQQTRGASQDELSRLAQSEQDRIDVLRAELNALRASGETSEQVTNRIKQLESQLDTASSRLDIFHNAVGKAPDAANDLSRNLQRQTDATHQASQAAQQAGGAFQQAASNIQSAAQQTSSSRFGEASRRRGSYTAAGGLRFSASAQRQINAGRARLGLKPLSFGKPQQEQQQPTQSFGSGGGGGGFSTSQASSVNRLIDIQNNLNQALAKARQDTIDRLADLKTTFRDDIADAFESGDFLSIRDIAKQRQRSERDILKEEERTKRDAQRSAQQEQLQIQQQGFSQSVSQARTWSQQFNQAISEGLARGGRSQHSGGVTVISRSTSQASGLRNFNTQFRNVLRVAPRG